MIYFLALLPATMLTIAGYVVLVLSSRSEGALRAFGRYLGFWAFTLAGLLVLGAIFAAAHGGGRCGMHAWAIHGPGSGERSCCGSCGCEPREASQPGGPHAGSGSQDSRGAPSTTTPSTTTQ